MSENNPNSSEVNPFCYSYYSQSQLQRFNDSFLRRKIKTVSNLYHKLIDRGNSALRDKARYLDLLLSSTDFRCRYPTFINLPSEEVKSSRQDRTQNRQASRVRQTKQEAEARQHAENCLFMQQLEMDRLRRICPRFSRDPTLVENVDVDRFIKTTVKSMKQLFPCLSVDQFAKTVFVSSHAKEYLAQNESGFIQFSLDADDSLNINNLFIEDDEIACQKDPGRLSGAPSMVVIGSNHPCYLNAPISDDPIEWCARQTEAPKRNQRTTIYVQAKKNSIVEVNVHNIEVIRGNLRNITTLKFVVSEMGAKPVTTAGVSNLGSSDGMVKANGFDVYISSFDSPPYVYPTYSFPLPCELQIKWHPPP